MHLEQKIATEKYYFYILIYYYFLGMYDYLIWLFKFQRTLKIRTDFIAVGNQEFRRAVTYNSVIESLGRDFFFQLPDSFYPMSCTEKLKKA